MTNNDILKRIRFAVKINDATMLSMLEAGGKPVSSLTLDSYFLKEGEEGYAECDEATLSALLDGMIVKFRGKRETAGVAAGNQTERGAKGGSDPVPSDGRDLDNNTILKKIRIALELKEEDMMAIMKISGVDLSKNELTALFRKKGHKNYRECMDQFLRNFLSGLARYGRH